MASHTQSPSLSSPRGSLFSIISFTCIAAEYSIFCFIKSITTSAEFIAGVLDICRQTSPLTLVYAFTPRALLTYAYNIFAFARSAVSTTLYYIWSFFLLCTSPICTLKFVAYTLVALASSLVTAVSKRRTGHEDSQPSTSQPVVNKSKLRSYSVGKISASKERPSIYHDTFKAPKHDGSIAQFRYSVVQDGAQTSPQFAVIERKDQAVRRRKHRGALDKQRRRSQNVNMVKYLTSEKARLQNAIDDLKAQVHAHAHDDPVPAINSKGSSPRLTPSLTLTGPKGHSAEYFDGKHESNHSSAAAEREAMENKISELSTRLENVMSEKERLEQQLVTLSVSHTHEGSSSISSRAESRGPDNRGEDVLSEPEESRPVFAPNEEMRDYALKPREISFRSAESRRVRSEDAQPSSASQQAGEEASLSANETPSISKRSFRRKVFQRSASMTGIAPEPADKLTPSRSPSMLMSTVRRLTSRSRRLSPSE